MTQIDILKAKYIENDQTVSFSCARCNEEKTGTGYWESVVDGKPFLICDDCYELLQSKQCETEQVHTDAAAISEGDLLSSASSNGTTTPRKRVALSHLTEEDLRYICQLITPREIRTYFQRYPKEFTKIRRGFRAGSLSDDDAITLVCKNASRPFLASFLERRLDAWLSQISQFRGEQEENGASPDQSLLLALPDSVFSDHIDLFFKVAYEEYSPEYIAVVKAALLLLDERPLSEESDVPSAAERRGTAGPSAGNGNELEGQVLAEKLRQEIESEQMSHGRTLKKLTYVQEEMAAMEQRLDAVVAENKALKENVGLMQAKLDRLNLLSQYIDTEAADTLDDTFENISVCEVFTDYAGQLRLSRLADIRDGKITRFVRNEDQPHFFENRDRLFWFDGPREEGFVGVWQWRAVPNKSDPATDYVTTSYSNIRAIKIVELAECHTYADIAHTLQRKTFPAAPGSKRFFACPDSDGRMIGLLCNESDFDVSNGAAKLKSSVYTLPRFEIPSADVLTVAGKKIYGFTSLGMPQGIFKVKDPLDVVKEVVISRATSAVFRMQGLSRREVQHCQNFLKDLPLQTIFQEIADAYACSEAEAQEYVSRFTEQADSYLLEEDLDIGTLAAALNRSKELVKTCKELLTAEWESENEEKLRNAQQELDTIQHAVLARRGEVDELEASHRALQEEMAKVQGAIDEKRVLADSVERKVAERIAAARKDASDLISELAFSAPEYATDRRSVAAPPSPVTVLSQRTIKGTWGEAVEDVESFLDDLTENLSAVGYGDVVAYYMAEIILFCIENHLPLVCGANALGIADCVAAMFGDRGAYTAALPISQPDCSGICAALQRESSDKTCVAVVYGVFDGLSLNGFNEIALQLETWGENVILVLPLNGVDAGLISSFVWGRSLFIDGDAGLDHVGTGDLTLHTTTAAFGVRYTAEEAMGKRKELKRLSGIISNGAMLNYAKFLAETDSPLKDNTQILTQIALHALSNGKTEQLIQELSSMGIDLTEIKEIAGYL